jgi:hypothetical protein
VAAHVGLSTNATTLTEARFRQRMVEIAEDARRPQAGSAIELITYEI